MPLLLPFPRAGHDALKWVQCGTVQHSRGRSCEMRASAGAEGCGVEGAEKTWGELCLFSAAAPWQRRGGHKAKEFALCRFSISEGAAGITGWGQGALAPAGRVPTVTLVLPLPLTQNLGDPGCCWILGQRLIAYCGQLDQYPPVPISPSPAAWEHWFGPTVPTAGRSGPGRHRQLPLCFCHVWGSVGTRCLLILKGQSSSPQGQGWPGRSLGSMAEGCRDHSTCCRQLPATCSLPPCSLPGPPHSASPVPNPRVPVPVPERGPACSGAHPLPLFPGLVSSGSCRGRSLSTRETEASYLLLIGMAPPGPAESGWRNVAAGQAAPRGVSGDVAAAAAGLPGCGVPWHPHPRWWALGQGCRGKCPRGRQVWG